MGNKKKFDIISISSDDDDDVPLKVYRTSSITNNATAVGLKIYNVQQCEFCDKVSLNRYDALIHNAKHIVIPLLKQTVHQCTECLYYFNSPQELKHHKKLKHNIDEPKIKVNHVTQEIVKENECEITKYDMIKIKSIEKLKMQGTQTKNNISSRLHFEEDLEDLENNTVGLLNDLTTECKVNMNLFDASWTGTGSLEKTESDSETSVVGNKVMEDVEFTASTHFEELMRHGMFRCRRCPETFSSRYNLIQHNMVHIKIRKSRPLLCTFCERFISNNRFLLRKHLYHKHSATSEEQNSRQKSRSHLQPCKKCGLKYYNYKRHMNNYHTVLYCHLCNEAFENDEERLNHIRGHLIETQCTQCELVSTAIEIQEHQRVAHRVSNITTIKICDMCCMFVKNKFNMQYVFLENVSEVGTRLQCERCFKLFFELKLVQRLHKRRDKEHDGDKEKKRHLTNNDRLKNIQQRLKMINKLSRF